MNGLIDTHVHLDFFEAPEDVVERARQQGVTQFIVPGVTPAAWPALLSLTESRPDVWIAPGVHPQAAGQWSRQTETDLRTLLRHPRVVAVGEIGLDKQAACPIAQQEKVCRQMIALAREHHLPLLLHVRRATERLLTLLKEEGHDELSGIVHAFSGSLETAPQFIDLGFSFGLGGVLTYPDAKRLPMVVRQLPADRLVLESDAPDMAPHPHRGKPNQPAYLPLVAESLALVRNWSLEHTIEVTTANAKKIFQLA